MVRIPTEEDCSNLASVNIMPTSFEEGFYFVFSGFAPGVIVGQMVISYTYDVCLAADK